MDKALEQIYSKMTDKEKQVFTRICHKQLMLQKFNGCNTSVIGLLVKQNRQTIFIALSGKQIKELNKIFIRNYATQEEKDQYTSYCRELAECYKIVSSTKGSAIVREDMASNKGINYNQEKIMALAHKYCFLLKDMDEKSVAEAFKRVSKYDSILKELMTIPIDDKDAIVSLLQSKTKKYIALLRPRICGYVLSEYPSLSVEQRTEIENQLKARINVYSKICAEQRKSEMEQKTEQRDKELLPEAKKTILTYINSDMTRRAFEKKHPEFSTHLDLIKEYDPITYKKFSQKASDTRRKSFNTNINVAHELLFYLKNGVSIGDGNTRVLDFLDYYLIIGVEPKSLTDCIKHDNSSISKSDYALLRRFISSLETNQTPLNIDQTMNTTLEVNSQRDENGWPIVGTGRIITNEEKQEVIDFLVEHNVPLTTKLYDIALKRYINGISNDVEHCNSEHKAPQLVKKPNNN